MTISSIVPTATSATASTGTGGTGSTGTGSGVMSAFRSADFLKIMLSEITNQDPMSPQDTSKMVEEMQSLQQLANAQYQQYRDDVKWAQNLMGQQVNVQQQGGLSDAAVASLKSSGLNPDLGYATKNGVVSSYKVVGQVVYVSMDGHDYPIDNVAQVTPKTQNPDTLTSVANELMGRAVSYSASDGSVKSGTVTSVGWASDGMSVQLTLDKGAASVPYASITSISIPGNANSN